MTNSIEYGVVNGVVIERVLLTRIMDIDVRRRMLAALNMLYSAGTSILTRCIF